MWKTRQKGEALLSSLHLLSLTAQLYSWLPRDGSASRWDVELGFQRVFKLEPRGGRLQGRWIADNPKLVCGDYTFTSRPLPLVLAGGHFRGITSVKFGKGDFWVHETYITSWRTSSFPLRWIWNFFGES